MIGATESTSLDLREWTFGTVSSQLSFIGDPVSTTHGYYFESNTDLRIAGPGGMDLALVRSYSSRLDFDGPFGYGWVTSFDQHLRAHQGDPTEIGDEAVIRVSERGTEEPFEDDGTLLTPQAWSHDQLVREADGSFTMITKAGIVYRFAAMDANGIARILSITDRNGNQLLWQYGGPAGELTAVFDATGDGSRKIEIFYDAAGKVDRLQDWTGRVWEYEVDANGDLVSYMDPEEASKPPGIGRAWSYEYLSGLSNTKLNHNMRKFRRPADRDGDPLAEGDYTMEFSYHPNDTVFKHVDGLGRETRFSFNYFRRRSTVTHPDGTTERYFYDAWGNITRHEDPRGAVTEWRYDGPRKEQIEEIDALGFRTTASYDAAGNISRRTDPLGNSETWSWNAFGQLVVRVDQRGNTTQWLYDSAGNPVETRAEVDGQLVTLQEIEYDNHGNAIRTTAHLGDGRRATTRLLLDANGVAAEQVIDAVGNTVRFTNDALGRPTRVETDRTVEIGGTERRLPVSAETKYDRLDRPYEVTVPGGVTTRTVFDPNGLPTQVSRLVPDPAAPQLVEQVVRQFRYDAMDRLVEVENALGQVTQREYDDRDRPVLLRSALGREARTSYDAAGNPVAQTDPTGHTSVIEFDPLGRPVSGVDALGRESTTRYDAGGRLLEAIAPGGRVTFQNPVYDESGNLLEVEDARGVRTVSTFDELGRPRSTTVAAGEPEEATTQFAYDLAGRLLRKTDPAGHDWHAVYDLVGRKTEESDPLGRVWSFSYDELGNLTVALDPAGYRVTHRYDARSLRTERTDQAPGETPRTLRSSYDALGRPVRSSLGAGSFTMRLEYDELDRVVTRSYGTSTERFVFDGDGRLVQHVLPTNVLPGGGGVATFGYDGRGLLSTVHDPEAGTWAFEYDALGRPVRQAGPIGDTRTVTYTPDGFIDRVDILVPGTAGEFADYSGYDAVGNPAIVTTTEGLTSLLYDSQSRVTNVTYPGTAGSEVFEYDVRGNRSRHIDRQGVARTYHYDLAQQLTEIKDEVSGNPYLQFGYDAAGRRTDRTEMGVGGTSYAYLGNGRLRAVTPPTGPATDLIYGPDGRRTVRADASGVSLYSHPQVEHRGGETWRWAGPGSGSAAVRYTASGKHVVHAYADGSASVAGVAETDEGGATLFEGPPRRYEVFGRVFSGSSVLERGFASQQHEGTTELILMGARHYDPEIGAFLQPDPVGALSSEIYRYAGGNPVRFWDPSGLSIRSIGSSASSFVSDGLSATGHAMHLNAELRLSTAKYEGMASLAMLTLVALPALGTAVGGSALGGGIAESLLPAWAVANPTWANTALGIGFGLACAEACGTHNLSAPIASSLGRLAGSSQPLLPALASLSDDVARTFAGRAYAARTLADDLVVYRAEGSTFGRWFGTTKPSSAAEAERLYNIVNYGNDLLEVSSYRIPAGTVIFEGPVKGGTGFQVYVEDPVRAGFKLLATEVLPQYGF